MTFAQPGGAPAARTVARRALTGSSALPLLTLMRGSRCATRRSVMPMSMPSSAGCCAISRSCRRRRNERSATSARPARSCRSSAHSPNCGDSNGTLEKIPGIGPASTRVILEVLDTGTSPTVERMVELSGRAAEVQQAPRLARAFHEPRRGRPNPLRPGIRRPARWIDYLGDLQMHSEWSDGSPALDEIVEACVARGYRFSAVTDHSYGLKIAGGMSMARRRPSSGASSIASMRDWGERFRSDSRHRGEHRHRWSARPLRRTKPRSSSWSSRRLIHACGRRGPDQPAACRDSHAARPRARASPRPHRRLARRRRSAMGRGVRRSRATGRRDRDRRRSGPSGSRSHTRGASARRPVASSHSTAMRTRRLSCDMRIPPSLMRGSPAFLPIAS